MRIRKMLKEKKGFTLIELIVVVAVLGILATIAIPRVGNIVGTAKSNADEMNKSLIINALERYNAEKGEYPTSLDVLVSSGYLDKIPKKSNNTDFSYSVATDKKSYTLQ
ncbi:competence type IV pilus major pilin ComGC [Thermovenabulum gondwanense]|uniref:Type II secretion system protein G n=1 Tax=Thermovenabulum gondwanense TaxID=520767 RepID=A0A162MH38_9FIRM|nr:prepilin-type N-terminal cleavage/methylation domain-containing protein [Thermovenabulum gondwanense]KYO65839.1 Type II secretion system protein G [Thermovenabulum gondwanense]